MQSLILSIGHNWGGGDQGATSQGTTEAIEVKKIIDGIIAKGIPGIKLIKVPEKLTLPQRIAWVNANFAKYPEPFAMEFHLDSAAAIARGASVWYNDSNEYTSNEGKQFLAEYTRVTGLPSRHVNSDKTNRLGDLGFVSQIKCASLLVELGFISNVQDLQTIRTKGVDAVISGVKAMNIN